MYVLTNVCKPNIKSLNKKVTHVCFSHTTIVKVCVYLCVFSVPSSNYYYCVLVIITSLGP